MMKNLDMQEDEIFAPFTDPRASVSSAQSVSYRCSSGASALRASKHKKERINKQDIKMNVTALCPPGLKSNCAGLLLRKENGKCDAAKHCAKFPNIGSHSPKFIA
ncbi:MAG: hypothetical protein KKA10_14870 [Euryarchaeota archaeon]|nr:hypothetical protein [Euryarchaeota archaeon]MDP3103771.1 hypothetical protein [Candidatus Methanoperedens sp.]